MDPVKRSQVNAGQSRSSAKGVLYLCIYVISVGLFLVPSESAFSRLWHIWSDDNLGLVVEGLLQFKFVELETIGVR